MSEKLCYLTIIELCKNCWYNCYHSNFYNKENLQWIVTV